MTWKPVYTDDPRKGGKERCFSGYPRSHIMSCITLLCFKFLLRNSYPYSTTDFKNLILNTKSYVRYSDFHSAVQVQWYRPKIVGSACSKISASSDLLTQQVLFFLSLLRLNCISNSWTLPIFIINANFEFTHL